MALHTLNKSLLFTFMFVASLLAQPAGAVPQEQPPTGVCENPQDIYAPDEDTLPDCLKALLQTDPRNAPPPTGLPGALTPPQDGDRCYLSGSYFWQEGDTEDKWTPLYGSNSPMQGSGYMKVEAGSTTELDIGFNFRGLEVQASRGATTFQGSGVRADNGESRIVFQWISWTEFTFMFCGADYEWHGVYTKLMPTDYTPTGQVRRQTGALEGSSLSTDWDNSLYPPGWSSMDTIGIDMAFYAEEHWECFDKNDYYFGASAIYKVNARMKFNGVFEVGGTYVHSESNTYYYDLRDGCYWIDYLGDEDQMVGWAFHPDPHRAPDGSCLPGHEEECRLDDHPPQSHEGTSLCTDTRSTPLDPDAVGMACQPAQPSPCAVLGGSLGTAYVDVAELQAAWLGSVDPTPESKLDLLEALCSGNLPCEDICSVDPCEKSVSELSVDVCGTVTEHVPDLCAVKGELCDGGAWICSGDSTALAPSPLCGESMYDLCDWSEASTLQGNAARDFACAGDFPEAGAACEVVNGQVTCPPVCPPSVCAPLNDAMNDDPCDNPAPSGTEYGMDALCGRDDLDPCDFAQAEQTVLCSGRLPGA